MAVAVAVEIAVIVAVDEMVGVKVRLPGVLVTVAVGCLGVLVGVTVQGVVGVGVGKLGIRMI